MKKLLVLSAFLGFFCLNLSAQNIYIRGKLEVIYIGPEGLDIICHPPYDKDCFIIKTEPALPSRSEGESIKQKTKEIQPKVQVIGESLDCDGIPTKVYRIRKDVIKEVIKN